MLLENTMNKWDDAERLRQVMSEKRMRKISWMELDLKQILLMNICFVSFPL